MTEEQIIAQQVILAQIAATLSRIEVLLQRQQVYIYPSTPQAPWPQIAPPPSIVPDAQVSGSNG